MEQPILQVEHLTKFFSVGPHAEVHAVDDVNFTLRRGRTFGLVGESGCGKSSCARTIIRIYEPSQGKIIFNGQDIAHLKPRQMQPVRRNMQMIFQDPYASLNARMTVRDIIAEPLKAHHVCKSKQEVDEKVFAMLNRVGLTAEHAGRYAHEFSGGQRQRVGIARALVLNPALVICDEPKFFLFPSFLEAWATSAGQTVLTYMIFTMVSINFALELVINLVLSTVIVRVIGARMLR